MARYMAGNNSSDVAALRSTKHGEQLGVGEAATRAFVHES